MTDEEYLIQLGKKIAIKRKNRGWTQAEFAKKLGMHRTNITRIELGNVNSTINMLRRIAESFDIALEDLIKQ